MLSYPVQLRLDYPMIQSWMILQLDILFVFDRNESLRNQITNISKSVESTPRGVPKNGVPLQNLSSYKLSKIADYLQELKEHIFDIDVFY